ncbi:amphi-Trp domain-containing protein [Nocardioides jishulii]|uniref:Amphi-Trp domain-containing protein n=1 Tax=Nocardioides jishulii TaxID=2575440 RepID=A0A4U2YTJ4_9ACTN|nr:amphi-Trp domain-containing protein [Nocardioides jishulii]QCX28934.1 amphi-Trp domain-containing protein [Nocardioides jishulii]TKI64165.1 amphi-Trp domain-containing protein [Nocardioides jishulii]
MDLFDIDDKQRLSREAAADKLRALADSLSRHNSVEFQRGGKTFTVAVPDEVELKIEVELGDGNELEIELTW